MARTAISPDRVSPSKCESNRLAPGGPALLEEFLNGEEGSYDSVMTDGQVIWDSVSHYLPTPLEVLRNPWIQWAVLMPRDIGGPEYEAIRAIARSARCSPTRTTSTCTQPGHS